MEYKENNNSNIIALLIIILIAVTIIAGSVCAYLVFQINSLQRIISDKDIQINEYKIQLEDQLLTESEALKKLFYTIDDYVERLESVTDTDKIGEYEKRRILIGKENVWSAMNDVFDGIPRSATIEEFAKLYFD